MFLSLNVVTNGLPTDDEAVCKVEHPQFRGEGAQHEACIHEEATEDRHPSSAVPLTDEVGRDRWAGNKTTHSEQC